MHTDMDSALNNRFGVGEESQSIGAQLAAAVLGDEPPFFVVSRAGWYDDDDAEMRRIVRERHAVNCLNIYSSYIKCQEKKKRDVLDNSKMDFRIRNHHELIAKHYKRSWLAIDDAVQSLEAANSQVMEVDSTAPLGDLEELIDGWQKPAVMREEELQDQKRLNRASEGPVAKKPRID